MKKFSNHYSVIKATVLMLLMIGISFAQGNEKKEVGEKIILEITEIFALIVGKINYK